MFIALPFEQVDMGVPAKVVGAAVIVMLVEVEKLAHPPSPLIA